MQKFDVIIIGARVAGATVALHLAHAGARVLLIDKSRLPCDAVSSSFLWPPTVTHLERLGVLAEVERGLPRLNSWLKFRDDITIEGRPPWTDSRPYGLSPKRLRLDEALLKRALTEGNVELWSPACFIRPIEKNGRIRGIVATQGNRERRASSSLVVGADGRHSKVARCVHPFVHRSYPPYRVWFVAHIEGWAGASHQVVTGMAGADWLGITSTHDGQVIASLRVCPGSYGCATELSDHQTD